MKDTYRTISKPSEGYYKDKGSRFLAYAYPVETEAETRELLMQLKKEHHSARHHCYAWRLGAENPAYRANDDGEPSSTAGRPILGQLLAYDVTNVFIVVVRYFGGTLLGTSGLINAYKAAAADALSNADIVTLTLETAIQLHYSYAQMNDVMLLIKQEDLQITNTRFEMDCSLDFKTRKSDVERVINLFSQIPGVKVNAAE